MNADRESTRERAAYAARIRRSNERLALAVAGFLAIVAALPVTHDDDRLGVLLCSLSLLALSVVWFRVLPARAFGDRRVVVFGLLAQPCVLILLLLTGGTRSEYFAFALLLVTATVFSPRTRHTVIVAIGTAVTLGLVGVLAPAGGPSDVVADLGTWLLEVAGFSLIAALIGRTLRESRASIAARADELDALRGRAEALALTDTLTGLYNRRYAGEALGRLIAEAQRGRAFSVATFDLDGFKRLNDTRGHAAGDDVLVAFAQLLRAGLRGSDVAVRLGGDEFAILLPGTGLAQAILVVERLRSAVREARWGEPDAIVTVSSGVTQWVEGQTAEQVLESADRSLYLQKRARGA